MLKINYMIIRLATLEDYLPVMNMYNYFVGEERYSNGDNDSFKQVLQSQLNYLYVAISENNEIIGFASMSIRSVVRYKKPIAEFDELYVNPKIRKQGIGQKLLEKLGETAEEQDCQRIYIESHYKHLAAHHFYENLGYVNYGYHFMKEIE
jgi:GNAT superfamily N-acetyltransferase